MQIMKEAYFCVSVDQDGNEHLCTVHDENKEIVPLMVFDKEGIPFLEKYAKIFAADEKSADCMFKVIKMSHPKDLKYFYTNSLGTH